jgi:PIN domain nuclease of toxin-antitoxin system
MKLLLDTHVLIWWFENSARLGSIARRAISSPDAVPMISVVSAWEMVIKRASGRVKMNVDPEDAIPRLFQHGFQPLSITFRHAFAVRYLPHHHADPFDRMLIAQAQCEDLTIVTADSKIAAYNVPTLDASR